ncbi:MAG: hypothetical protein WAU07_02730 [Microgenomates group bacterium]
MNVSPYQKFLACMSLCLILGVLAISPISARQPQKQGIQSQVRPEIVNSETLKIENIRPQLPVSDPGFRPLPSLVPDPIIVKKSRVSPTPTATPPVSKPSPTPQGSGQGSNGPGGSSPQPNAPKCSEENHDPTVWHGLWNSELGCHYDHEHKMNPHDFDDVFGTEIYEWAGGEISYPWQTYAGASDSFETYQSGTCTENTCKHEGYKWLGYKDRTTSENISGALLLGSHAITDARVQYHQIGGEIGAFTRFHSVWLEARACYEGNISDETCGLYRGGGWLDFGRLNYPRRGDYLPLPGDPEEFADTPAELAPYRIHATGQNSLDSWQSEGNIYNYLPSDPMGRNRIRVGHGIHFLQGESSGEITLSNIGTTLHTGMTDSMHFWCLDPVTNQFTCTNNNSAAALFRTWVQIPTEFDGSQYDEDGSQNGYVTFNLYTNRYGDVTGGCTEVGLDCIPAVAENFPVGGCNHPDGFCRAAYRGSAEQDGFDADVSPVGENWIEFPN